MAANSALHPTDRTLQSYGLGKLDDASAEAVNKHLEGCPDCRRRAAEVSSDTFLGRLRDAKAQPSSLHPAVSSTDGLSMLDAGAAVPAPPPASTLPPGLADHPDYHVLRELGQGGMGVVYLAQNTLMGRLEVLKVVSGHLVNRKGVLDRFLGEIRNAARLHHPNIVTAYTTLRLGESLALAMEYVEGLDLARLVRSRGPLPVANACNYIHQAALGLQHAHENGMVHRDIKPSNLMLTRQGNRALIKVLDFGLAKVRSEGAVDGGLTNEGQMLGTPHYIAPEQTIDARRADIRADIYSLGCTLYFLLTGAPPFDGVSLYDILQAHHSREALPLNLARPEIPVESAALVAKMIAKEPERRFQEPKEVAQALKPFFKSGEMPSGSKPDVSQPGRAAADPGASRTTKMPTESARHAAPRSGKTKVPGAAQAEPARNSLIDLRENQPLHDSLLDSPGRAVTPKAMSQDPRPWSTAVTNLARRVPGGWWTIAGVFLLCSVFALSAVVLKVRTPDGVIVLENVPADAIVEIDGIKITIMPKEGEPIRITKPPGIHRVEVFRGETRIHGDTVTLESGKNLSLTVKIDPSEITKTDGNSMGLAAKPESNDSTALQGMGMMGGRFGGMASQMNDQMSRMMGGGMTGGQEIPGKRAIGRGMTGMMGGPRVDDSAPPKGMGMMGGMGIGGMTGRGMMDGLASRDQTAASPPSEITDPPHDVPDEGQNPLKGRNFEGWHGYFRTRDIAPSEVFWREGDEIFWNGHAGRIHLDQSFSNFLFRFDYRLPAQGHKGTTFCCLKFADGEPYQVDGLSFRVGTVYCALSDGRRGETGNLLIQSYDTSKIVEHSVRRRADASRPINEWNRVEVRCEGRVMTFCLNGILVNRIQTNRAIVCHPGLNSWDADIRFRNVRIVTLAQANHTQVDSKKANWRPKGQSRSGGRIDREVPDALQPGSIWKGTHFLKRETNAEPQRIPATFVVRECRGESFVARYEAGGNIREIRGRIKEMKIRWLSRDVRVIKGHSGHDTTGMIHGAEMSLTFSGIDPDNGNPVAGAIELHLEQ